MSSVSFCNAQGSVVSFIRRGDTRSTVKLERQPYCPRSGFSVTYLSKSVSDAEMDALSGNPSWKRGSVEEEIEFLETWEATQPIEPTAREKRHQERQLKLMVRASQIGCLLQ